MSGKYAIGIGNKNECIWFDICFSHISSDEDTELDANLIDLNGAENELAHLNKNKDTAQSLFNM